MAGREVVTGREINKEFVHQALRDAGLSGSDSHKDYAARRLDDGDGKYGAGSYLSKDPAAEAAEEGIDGANWLGFEVAKNLEKLTPDEQRLLSVAAQHFALAYENITQYLESRDR